MAAANQIVPPRVGDIVHYKMLMPDVPGCQAAIVTDTHLDPALASLAVFHANGTQYLPQVRHVELEYMWEQYEPGTWHRAEHQ